MRLSRIAVKAAVVCMLLGSTAYADTIFVLTHLFSETGIRYPYLRRRTVWVYPYYNYQPYYQYSYLGDYLEYLRRYELYPGESRYMVWTGDGRYLGPRSPVWTADGKDLYGLTSVWDGKGKNLTKLGTVWTGDGEALFRLGSVWTGDGRQLMSLPAWTEGFFK